MLLYTAELKRPMTEPYEKKVEIVDRFIELLALEACKDVLIGNPLHRCVPYDRKLLQSAKFSTAELVLCHTRKLDGTTPKF
jgi:hypothetical protein